MSTRQVTAIAIKLLAIWLLVNVIIYIPSFALVFTGLQNYNQQELPLWLYYALVGTSLVIGFVATLLLMRTANSVLSSADPAPTNDNGINQSFLLQVGGIFFIVSALSVMPAVFLNLGKASTIQTNVIFYIGGYLFELSAGLYLLVKPNVWVHWLNKFRGRS